MSTKFDLGSSEKNGNNIYAITKPLNQLKKIVENNEVVPRTLIRTNLFSGEPG